VFGHLNEMKKTLLEDVEKFDQKGVLSPEKAAKIEQ
jgi:hypothetical protein